MGSRDAAGLEGAPDGAPPRAGGWSAWVARAGQTPPRCRAYAARATEEPRALRPSLPRGICALEMLA